MPKKESAVFIQEAVYTPNSHLGIGWRVWSEMVQELARSRGLMWRLFLRELSARYRQTAFGYIWAFLPAKFLFQEVVLYWT